MLDYEWFGYGVTTGLMFFAAGIAVVIAPAMLFRAIRAF